MSLFFMILLKFSRVHGKGINAQTGVTINKFIRQGSAGCDNLIWRDLISANERTDP